MIQSRQTDGHKSQWSTQGTVPVQYRTINRSNDWIILSRVYSTVRLLGLWSYVGEGETIPLLQSINTLVLDLWSQMAAVAGWRRRTAL